MTTTTLIAYTSTSTFGGTIVFEKSLMDFLFNYLWWFWLILLGVGIISLIINLNK